MSGNRQQGGHPPFCCPGHPPSPPLAGASCRARCCPTPSLYCFCRRCDRAAPCCSLLFFFLIFLRYYLFDVRICTFCVCAGGFRWSLEAFCYFTLHSLANGRTFAKKPYGLCLGGIAVGTPHACLALEVFLFFFPS